MDGVDNLRFLAAKRRGLDRCGMPDGGLMMSPVISALGLNNQERWIRIATFARALDREQRD
jgi:hypothetical protein